MDNNNDHGVYTGFSGLDMFATFPDASTIEVRAIVFDRYRSASPIYVQKEKKKEPTKYVGTILFSASGYVSFPFNIHLDGTNEEGKDYSRDIEGIEIIDSDKTITFVDAYVQYSYIADKVTDWKEGK